MASSNSLCLSQLCVYCRGTGIDQMLALVEHDERRSITEVVHNSLMRRATWLFADLERRQERDPRAAFNLDARDGAQSGLCTSMRPRYLPECKSERILAKLS